MDLGLTPWVQLLSNHKVTIYFWKAKMSESLFACECYGVFYGAFRVTALGNPTLVSDVDETGCKPSKYIAQGKRSGALG